MRHVTRNIDLDHALDLLDRPARACLSFVDDTGPRVVPVTYAHDDGRHVVDIAAGAGPCPDDGQEVVVLVDEGVWFFELRAVYVRGRATRVGDPPGTHPGGRRFAVAADRVVAWDYGRLREVDRDG